MSALNVYLLHSESLTNRKAMCEDLRKRLGSKATFQYVMEHEVDSLTGIPTGELVNLDRLPEPDYADFNKILHPMTLRSVSNCMKHLAAMRLIQGKSDKELHLILEDDACFAETVVAQLEEVMCGMSAHVPDADIVFVGFPGIPTAPNGIPFVPTTEVYRVLPGCDSYFITPSAAARLCGNYLPVKFINNAQLSYMIQFHGLKAYMSTPHVFIEGSKLGTYVSSLNPNNMLIYNPAFREMFEIVHKEGGVFDQDDKNKLDALWSGIAFKSHPDFMYLKGLFMLKDKQFAKAKEIFEKVFHIYQDNRCILSRDSNFLNNYVELSKVFQ